MNYCIDIKTTKHERAFVEANSPELAIAAIIAGVITPRKSGEADVLFSCTNMGPTEIKGVPGMSSDGGFATIPVIGQDAAPVLP